MKKRILFLLWHSMPYLVFMFFSASAFIFLQWMLRLGANDYLLGLVVVIFAFPMYLWHKNITKTAWGILAKMLILRGIVETDLDYSIVETEEPELCEKVDDILHDLGIEVLEEEKK